MMIFGSRLLRVMVVFGVANSSLIFMNLEKIKNFFYDIDSIVVLVAAEQTHRGQPLTPDLVLKKRIPKSVYKSIYYTANELTEAKYSQYVVAEKSDVGQFLTRDNVIFKDDAFIGKLLKPHYRAIYLRIKKDQLAKDLHGGWRVDITVTDVAKKETKTILCGVKVLDVATDNNNGKTDDADKNKSYIILELAPEEAPILLTSYETGILNFLSISRVEADYDLGCAKKELKTQVIRGRNA